MTFQECHIINTDLKDPVQDPTKPYWARCYVTRRVLYENQPVGYLYRENPDRENDSGWRITAGNESDEYMDDPENHSYVSLGAVLSEDDSILSLLERPAPCAFVRDEQTGAFEAVDPPDESNTESAGGTGPLH